MSNVYIPQPPPPTRNGWVPDLSSAIEFGRLQYVFDAGEKVYALPGPSMFKARKALRDFNPKEDFILWPNTGDPASLWITLIVAMEHDPEFIRFLYWDRKRTTSGERDGRKGFYVECKIPIKEAR